MANTVDVNVILDTDNLAILHVYLESDGSSGELTDSVIFDASALAGAKNAANILRIAGCLSGFKAKLEFDATTDTGALILPQESEINLDFSGTPIKNNAGSGITGDIVLSTSGFSAAGDYGFFIITVKKAT